MALKNLFDMVKADRYTQDGREAIIKAQEAETEDATRRTYQIGEISQSTGLQKTANGWVKPKNGKQPGAKKEEPKNVHGAEVDKIYERQLKRIKELKAKGFTDEQIDNDKIIKQTKEDMKNVGKKPESKPQPVSPINKEKLLDSLSFDLVDTTSDIEEEYNAVEHSDNSRLPEFVRQQVENEYVNKTNGEKWSDEEKDIIAEEVTRRIKERQSKKTAESKPDAADQRDQIGGEIKENLEAAKYYFDKAQSFSPTDPSYKTYMTKAKQYNDEAKAQADDNGFDFEEMHNSGITQAVNKYAEEQSKTEGRNFRSELEANPKGAYDFEKTIEHSIPLSAGDKEILGRVKSFMQEESTDYKNALKSVATGLVNGNKLRGDWYPEKEQSLLKIAKAVGMDDEVKSYVKTLAKGYDFGYSEDAAPRVLTGDCRIRIRKEKPALTGDTKIRVRK